MNTSAAVGARAANIAAGQWGLLTTAQAELAGITRLQLSRLAAIGLLEPTDRGVYAITGTEDPHRALRAAWVTLDPTHTAEERLADLTTAGVVSHTSAAGLRSLGDLPDDRPEFILAQRKQTRRAIRLHRATLTESDVELVEGLPTTTVERTVADLLRDGQDPDLVAQIVGQAVRRNLVDLEVLASHLQGLAKARGQQDGAALAQHLLDIAGFSLADQVTQLGQTAVGEVLRRAGQTEAFSEMVAAMAAFWREHTSSQLAELAKVPMSAVMPPPAIPQGLFAATLSPESLERLRELTSATLAASMKIDWSTIRSLSGSTLASAWADQMHTPRAAVSAEQENPTNGQEQQR